MYLYGNERFPWEQPVLNTFQCSHFLWLLEGQKLAHVVSKEEFSPRKVTMPWMSCSRQGLAWTLGAPWCWCACEGHIHSGILFLMHKDNSAIFHLVCVQFFTHLVWAWLWRGETTKPEELCSESPESWVWGGLLGWRSPWVQPLHTVCWTTCSVFLCINTSFSVLSNTYCKVNSIAKMQKDPMEYSVKSVSPSCSSQDTL